MTGDGGKTSEGRTRKGSYAAPALDKAFLIIELLASHPQGMLVSEMATALGRSLGELFRIVVVMKRRATSKSRRSTIGIASPINSSTSPIAPRPRGS